MPVEYLYITNFFCQGALTHSRQYFLLLVDVSHSVVTLFVQGSAQCNPIYNYIKRDCIRKLEKVHPSFFKSVGKWHQLINNAWRSSLFVMRPSFCQQKTDTLPIGNSQPIITKNKQNCLYNLGLSSLTPLALLMSQHSHFRRYETNYTKHCHV